MKKKLGLLLGAAAASVMMALNVGAVTEEEVLGTWYLNKISEDGIEFNNASLGLAMTMEISTDGTFVMTSDMNGEKDSSDTAQWILEGDVIKLCEPDDVNDYMEGTIEDGILSVESDGTILTFGREEEEADTVDTGAQVTNPTVEELQGEWKATYMESSGVVLPMDIQSEMSMNFKIEGDQAHLVIHVDDEDTEADADVAIKDDAVEVSMSAEIVGTDLFSENIMEMKYYENGYLVWAQGTDGELGSFYFERVEQE
ncbi:MAG: lipocalin family protein [Eubacteriales bacterium]|nr:lipocalin family protein [Eubacteriales bacterium]